MADFPPTPVHDPPPPPPAHLHIYIYIYLYNDPWYCAFSHLNMSGEVQPLQDSPGVGEEGELGRHLQVLTQQLSKGNRFH